MNLPSASRLSSKFNINDSMLDAHSGRSNSQNGKQAWITDLGYTRVLSMHYNQGIQTLADSREETAWKPKSRVFAKIVTT